MLPAKTLFRYRSFYLLKTLSRTACWVAVFLSSCTFVWKNVDSFNAKLRSESMNCILLFFSVIDELQSKSN